ncbi:MAG: ABC transporter ATP-binding protein [Planctomycetota bacterium]
MSFECIGLSKAFHNGSASVVALADTSFSVADREFVCIVGPSGCGKTTLLKLIAGLMTPTAGRIVFHDEDNGHSLKNALVFQEHGLFPWMTVLDNVAFGLEMQRVPRRERRRRALAFVDSVGLGPFADGYPHTLSVGMRQRVGIARAFLADTQTLLMDEPLGAVDAQTKRILQEELLRIWQQHRKLVLYVTHDIEEAVLLGDRVLVMTGRPGRIREEIPVPLPRPRHLTKDAPEITEIKWHIWKMLEDEVRRCLQSP